MRIETHFEEEKVIEIFQFFQEQILQKKKVLVVEQTVHFSLVQIPIQIFCFHD
jgi:hypothetical protein